MISFHQVASYLLQREIIEPASVISRLLEVTPLSGRNYNCLVRDRSRAIVLKQGIWLEENRKAFQTEQRFFREVLPLLSPESQAQIPRVVLNDAEQAALAVEFVPNAMPALQALQAMPSQAQAIGHQLGDFMGRFHAETAVLPLRRWTDWLSGDPPWALGLHCPSARHFRLISPGSYQCLKAVQRMPELCTAIQRERECWRTKCIIHADMKSDNLLLAAASDGGSIRLTVIDWELAQLGDPAWDIAGFLHDIFVSWIYLLPMMPLPGVGQQPWSAARPLALHCAVVRGFMEAYATATGRAPLSGVLDRAFVLSGARLVQFAVECAQHQTEVPHQCKVALGLAERAMCVQGWARELFLPSDSATSSVRLQ